MRAFTNRADERREDVCGEGTATPAKPPATLPRNSEPNGSLATELLEPFMACTVALT